MIASNALLIVTNTLHAQIAETDDATNKKTLFQDPDLEVENAPVFSYGRQSFGITKMQEHRSLEM